MKAAPCPTFMEKETDQQALKKLLLLAGFSALAMFLPFLLADGGRFALISDFNFQQIPFNMHANWALKNGQIGWDWFTDLGVNFIGAFSFYNLGSPFFWLTLPFPKETFPYLIGWLYVLKYVAAAAFAFLWIRRHVQDPDYAVIGALLYAFSGFSHINLQFYHFHEVIAFFPLLLYALDRLVLEDRRGWFALVTALMVLVNYFFFFGQVLFLLLYFFTVYRFPSGKERKDRFLAVLIEGVLGGMAASILLLPSAFFILFSPKTGDMLSFKDFFLFSKERSLTIVKALLFPAEAMTGPSAFFLFDYSSASFYLPALGLSMALAGTHRSRFRRLLPLLALMAFIPVLNASFTLFNALYYARWFYMPALLAAAVSAEALEKAHPMAKRRGLQLSMGLTISFLALGFLLAEMDTVYFVPSHFLLTGGLALAGLLLTWLILTGTKVTRLDGPTSGQDGAMPRQETALKRRILILVTGFSIITGLYSLSLTRSADPTETRAFARGYLFRMAEIPLGEEGDQDFRFYSDEPAWNLALLNHVPSVNSFITTNSPSTYEFFDAVGIRHIPTSLFPEKVHDILTFLSVRYRLDTGIEPVSGWIPRQSFDNGYQTVEVLENPDFIPFGFPLDHFIHKGDLLAIPEEERAGVLIQALVVPDGLKAPEHLEPFPTKGSPSSLAEIAQDKRSHSVQNFRRDSRGFSADVTVAEPTTFLFTVPADQGWRASIDGREAPFMKSLGFLALTVPPGPHRIEFTYRIPGLISGVLLSVTGFMLIVRRIRKDRKAKQCDATRPAP